MKNTFRALKAGIRGFADANGPSRYVAVGRQVSCTHCGMSLFVEREALLNTTGATLVNRLCSAGHVAVSIKKGFRL